MAIAEIEGGGAVHMRGRVRGGGHNGVPSVWLRRLLGQLTGVEAHPPALMFDN